MRRCLLLVRLTIAPGRDGEEMLLAGLKAPGLLALGGAEMT